MPLLPLGPYQHRYLLGQLIKRDVLLRYRGAYFGLLWIFLNPLIMLGIFSFVFGQIFQARWATPSNGMPYALNLYCGLIAFNIFAETVSRAPAAVRSQPSYVKKIIFPVEILPIVPLGSALIHGLFNTLILLAVPLPGLATCTPARSCSPSSCYPCCLLAWVWLGSFPPGGYSSRT